MALVAAAAVVDGAFVGVGTGDAVERDRVASDGAAALVTSEDVDAELGAATVVLAALVEVAGEAVGDERELAGAVALEAADGVGAVVGATALVGVGALVTVRCEV